MYLEERSIQRRFRESLPGSLNQLTEPREIKKIGQLTSSKLVFLL